MITRRATIGAIAAALGLPRRTQARMTGPPPTRGVDEHGTYSEYLIAWTPYGNVYKRIYDKIPKRPDGSNAPGAVAVSVRPRLAPSTVPPDVAEANFEAAKQRLKDENSDVVVDDKASASSYSFGNAGSGAVITTFAYGIAASIAGLPNQAERIAAIQAEVSALQGALQAQQVSQAEAGALVAKQLAERGARLDSLLAQGQPSQALISIAQALDVNGQADLFATTDIVFAQQLHEVTQALRSQEAASRPHAVLEFGRALVRQADAEHAAGNFETADEIYGLVRTIADVAIGLDPLSGAIRSTYELVTGTNLVTGQALSAAERGFAAVNLVLLGGFSTVSRGMQALGRAAAVIGGTRGRSIVQTIFHVATTWPTKTIDRILSWRANRLVTLQGESIALKATREIVPVGAVDGVYARVMPRQAAEQVLQGGALSRSDNLAFITEAQAISDLRSANAIADRLGLMEISDGVLKRRDLADHVILEFKFTSNEPLAYLAKPFGEAGSHGPAFLPGGYASGGAVEWVVDSAAASKGMIDLGTIRIRTIPLP